MAKNCIKFEWPNSGVLKLIEPWSTYECFDAYIKMCVELQQDCPNVEVNDVKVASYNCYYYLVKICLRFADKNNVFARYARVRGTRKSGAGTDDVHKSSAYWYPYMSFIHFVQIRKAASNLDSSLNETTYQSEDGSNEQNVDETPPNKRCRMETPTSSKNTDSADEALHAASQALRSIANSIVEKNSIDDSFINFLKDEMRSISDTHLRRELRKNIIQDIFEIKERMNNLSE